MESLGSRITRRTFLEAGAIAAASLASGRWALAEAERRALPYSDYARHDAIGLAQLVARGEVQPSELLEAAIARSEAVNPKINAVVLEHFARGRAALREGLPQGPFRGVPFMLKDLGAGLAGTITTNGSRFFADAVASRTSTLVERYEAAGLVIFGKTASPEFGATSTTESKLWGKTRNPWNLELSAGGSSGGAAAAIAAGIVPAAHASDGGGSIRIPAANCGLFGIKPTRGRTPQGPYVFDAWGGLSIAHVISRSVRDSAALLDATQGGELGDPWMAPARVRPYLDEVAAPPGRLRIGVQRRSFMPVETHAECLAAVDAAAKLCESLGHHVEEIEPPPLPPDRFFEPMVVMKGTALVMSVGARQQVLGRVVTQADLETRNWSDYQDALSFTAPQYEIARQTAYAFGRIVVQHQKRFDAVLSPTLAVPPPKLGILSLSNMGDDFAPAAVATSAFTAMYNISGQPAMSVPLHWSEAGIPIGTMFAGPPGGEAQLFRLAAQLEAARPWHDRRPAI
ncbi:MAG: amidase [Deltaproteobacteria bacterium]|nr:amidase [Deltaproteobacteria bacterium]MBW2419913.1 amidase [Deltaproteobacteria bacterium]